jgi:SAM-dependent methyltransferase
VVAKIPRFVSRDPYAEAFGAQWKRYRRTQLDSYTGFPLSRDRARAVLGETLWSTLSGKNVLECGCGAGRFTEVLLSAGARVTSIDLSDAVEANGEGFPPDEGHRIAQADIMRLPFAPFSFDVVFCLGVIQHTPSPEATLESLYQQVRAGGTLAVDHYSHSLSHYTKTALPLRYYYRRLPPDRGLPAIEHLVDRLLPLHRAVRRQPWAQAILSRFSPVLCYYRKFPQFSDELQREWALLDTHDSLTCWYRHSRSRRALRRTLEVLGAEEILCEYGENGVIARARRPQPSVKSPGMSEAG